MSAQRVQHGKFKVKPRHAHGRIELWVNIMRAVDKEDQEGEYFTRKELTNLAMLDRDVMLEHDSRLGVIGRVTGTRITADGWLRLELSLHDSNTLKPAVSEYIERGLQSGRLGMVSINWQGMKNRQGNVIRDTRKVVEVSLVENGKYSGADVQSARLGAGTSELGVDRTVSAPLELATTPTSNMSAEQQQQQQQENVPEQQQEKPETMPENTGANNTDDLLKEIETDLEMAEAEASKRKTEKAKAPAKSSKQTPRVDPAIVDDTKNRPATDLSFSDITAMQQKLKLYEAMLSKPQDLSKLNDVTEMLPEEQRDAFRQTVTHLSTHPETLPVHHQVSGLMDLTLSQKKAAEEATQRAEKFEAKAQKFQRQYQAALDILRRERSKRPLSDATDTASKVARESTNETSPNSSAVKPADVLAAAANQGQQVPIGTANSGALKHLNNNTVGVAASATNKVYEPQNAVSDDFRRAMQGIMDAPIDAPFNNNLAETTMARMGTHPYGNAF